MLIHFSPRKFVAIVILAGVTGLGFGVSSGDAAAQSVQKLRPNCAACDKDRKTFDDLNKSIDAKRLTPRDKMTAQQRGELDRDVRARNEAKLRLDNCKKMCPASIFLKRTKPITVGSCPACQKIADALASLLNQKARAEGELGVLKARKANVSITAPAEKLVQQLTEQIRKKTQELTACEQKFCLGKQKGQNAKVTPKDLVKPKKKDAAGDPK